LPGGTHANQYQLRGDGGLLHIKESPATLGLYYATNAHEFGTHAAGQIISITGAPTLNADQMVVTPITHPIRLRPQTHQAPIIRACIATRCRSPTAR